MQTNKNEPGRMLYLIVSQFYAKLTFPDTFFTDLVRPAETEGSRQSCKNAVKLPSRTLIFFHFFGFFSEKRLFWLVTLHTIEKMEKSFL